MQRAITAARRAFDETDWATNREFRTRCLLQLAEALAAEREELRAEIVAEVGCPVSATAVRSSTRRSPTRSSGRRR